MIRDDLPKYFRDDVVFALGEDGGKLWDKYCTIRERLTAEVDAGSHPELDGKDVGILHRMVKEFQIDDPMDFRMALNRITIDKDYYGSAKIGMGDLLAIRSIESFLVSRVERRILEALRDRPLIHDIVGTLRHLGHSRGMNRDIALAEKAVSSCLATVAAVAVEQNGNVTSSDMERLALHNGIRHLENAR